MSTATLIRWTGPISLLAGALYALAAFLHPAGEDLAAYTSANWVLAHMLCWVAVLLMQIGLVGAYAHQAEKLGWLGLAGFVLAFIGTAFVGTIQFMAATVIHAAATQAPGLFAQFATPPLFAILVVVLGFSLGYVLFGLATMRAGVLPRGSGLLLILGIALFIVTEAGPFGPALAHALAVMGDTAFGLGFAWMGLALWSDRRGAQPQEAFSHA